MAQTEAELRALWTKQGKMDLRSNLEIFRSLVEKAKGLVQARRFDDAAAHATMAAYHAHRRHCGLFASNALEQLLLATGRAAIHAVRAEPLKVRQIDRVLHVGTNMSVYSGNPRLIRRWMQQDAAHSSSLVLTKQAPDAVPKPIIDLVAQQRGRVHILNDGKPSGFIARAQRLRHIASEADIIVLHCWEIDVVPMIAFADDLGLPPIIYVNGGDHWFWLGRSISDVVISLRESGKRLAMTRRGIEGIRNELLPTPMESLRRTCPRVEAKRRIGIDPEVIMLLCIAGAPKFRTIGGPNFVEVHVPVLLSCKNVVLVVIGPGKAEDWSAAIRQTGGRIKVLEPTEDTAMYYQAADIYVDSFPFTSITSLLEAGSFGTPLVSRFPFPEGSEILGSDAPGLDGCLLRANSLKEYRDALYRLVKNPAERQSLGEKTRQRIEGKHCGERWRRRLEEIYEQAIVLPRAERRSDKWVDEPFEDEPDVYLPIIHGHTWNQNFIIGFVLSSMSLFGKLEYFTLAKKLRGTRKTIASLLPEWLYIIVGKLVRSKRRTVRFTSGLLQNQGSDASR